MVKIELIGDSEGEIWLFINGQPRGSYFADTSLPIDLENILEEELCNYKPSDKNK